LLFVTQPLKRLDDPDHALGVLPAAVFKLLAHLPALRLLTSPKVSRINSMLTVPPF